MDLKRRRYTSLNGQTSQHDKNGPRWLQECNKQKYICFSPPVTMCPSIPTKLCTQPEDVCPISAPLLNVLGSDPLSIGPEKLGELHYCFFAYRFLIYMPNLKLLRRPYCNTKSYTKIMNTDQGIEVHKIRNFYKIRNPPKWLDQCEIWYGTENLKPPLLCKILQQLYNVSPLWVCSENPIITP